MGSGYGQSQYFATLEVGIIERISFVFEAMARKLGPATEPVPLIRGKILKPALTIPRALAKRPSQARIDEHLSRCEG